MGDISPHFNRTEFECKGLACCSHSAPISGKLIQALEHLRLAVYTAFPDKDRPIYINSGFRCRTFNRIIGSADTSQHTLGLAADIIIPDLTPLQIAYIARRTKPFDMGGIGIYDDFVHVDVRPNGPARW